MKNHKILLIEPPFYRLFKETYGLVRYPLSLGYLAASIKAGTDWDVMAYNADFTPASDSFEVTYFKSEGFTRYRRLLSDTSHPVWQGIRDVISGYAPAVVGISAKSSTFTSVLRVAGIAKAINPEVVIVVGGPHPSALFSKAFDPKWAKDNWAKGMEAGGEVFCRDIDIFVVGEGEETIVALLDALERHKSPGRIRGIVYGNGEELIATLPGRPVKNLDVLPLPYQYAPHVLKDYEIYPLSAFSNIFATRGCPYHCLFCGSRNIWGRGVRFRSPRNVVEEILYLRNIGINDIHFDDDTFGVTTPYLQTLCRTIKSSCPGLSWSCEIHVNLVNDKNISIMKEAGCFMIQLGIESGNNEILKEVRKGFTIEEALVACNIIRNHGINLQTFFMAGFPQETEASLKDTAKVIEEIECEKIIYSIFTPYPGTEAFELCQDKGMITPDYDPSLYCHQSPENCFCANISPERFSKLSSRIEEMVVQKNRSRV
ncbi:MAG: radical SAM protein [Proteobacteria bacterium]|nr:radical SAM protein [Pseudomonadota bacterium]